jgi:hypothetical protein
MAVALNEDLSSWWHETLRGLNLVWSVVDKGTPEQLSIEADLRLLEAYRTAVVAQVPGDDASSAAAVSYEHAVRIRAAAYDEYDGYDESWRP